MAFNFNGNTPKKILYNGLNVAKLIYNGVVVWMSKVLATVSGILPLTLTNSTGDDLVDYRIYGANGGVGDKTDNLWNEKATTDTDKYINASGNIATGAKGDRFLYLKVNVSPSTNYVFKWTENVLGTDDNTAYIRISEYTQSNRFIRRVLCNCSEQTQKAFSFTTASNTSYIDVRTDSATSIRGQHLTGVMLITGTSIPETYEPYGYKVPVRCGGTTTNIYLDEPLRKTSKLPTGYTEVETVYYTDYLDFANQKVVRNVDDNDKGIDTPVEESVALPAVPTDEGTTVFDVDTDVTPSYAEVVYYKNDV